MFTACERTIKSTFSKSENQLPNQWTIILRQTLNDNNIILKGTTFESQRDLFSSFTTILLSLLEKKIMFRDIEHVFNDTNLMSLFPYYPKKMKGSN